MLTEETGQRWTTQLLTLAGEFTIASRGNGASVDSQKPLLGKLNLSGPRKYQQNYQPNPRSNGQQRKDPNSIVARRYQEEVRKKRWENPPPPKKCAPIVHAVNQRTRLQTTMKFYSFAQGLNGAQGHGQHASSHREKSGSMDFLSKSKCARN